MSTDCLFCRIAAGELGTEFVYEDDHVVAFKDIAPKAKHHLLIIPRQHFATLNEPSENDPKDQALLGHMMLTAQKLAKQLSVDQSGYRVVMNCNRDGGQEVFHIHLHLLGGEPLSWFK